ncbi:MAG TPA: hypothetical protein P5309_05980 [Syntrophomonadaceae bacterium]|nr:hypothetical protein [Syntrophomonadaceae bacterium]
MAINSIIFLLIFNWSYIQKRRVDPNYPPKPIAQSILFPLGLAVAFTMLVDAYRGVMYYQLIMFLLVAALLFWMFYGKKS